MEMAPSKRGWVGLGITGIF
ncbi:uncharacterized protein G2W53_019610 [Senna tora]|uniref:Uncharacterized protein n=1 Tax=Senna tora TaxID=362788 RepID=A0A834TY43_9FABA|nr:uncharacterized protein G2W53_019610 [Senna tora]